MARVGVKFINSPEQWSVLTAPARFEIIEAMQELAPCGIRAIADQLGAAPDTLYRHMDVLIKAGYVVHAGFRKVPRATEQLFDLTADDFQIRFDTQADPGPANDMIRDTAAAFFKRVQQTLDRAAAARALNATQEGINLTLLNEYARLTADEFKQLRSLLRQAKQLLDNTRRRSAGDVPVQLYNVLMVAAPVISNRAAEAQARFNGSPKAKQKTKPIAGFNRKQSNPTASGRGRKKE